MASLVCGILAIPLGFLFFPVGIILGIIAIVMGILGRRDARRWGTTDGKATAGLVTGIIGTLIGIGMLVFTVLIVSETINCAEEPTEAERQACVERELSD